MAIQVSRPGSEVARGDEGDRLRFDPRLLVAAIRYHLIDEGLVERMSLSSLRGTLRRLRRRRVIASVPKEQWATMTDPQRLLWLLDTCETDFEVAANGVGVLRDRSAV